ncbi:glycoside hydrolase family 95 protein [Mucilaginibacter humi]|uniref:glycoside hydrolase family 95 protein n=1 Tax=Mucilaginibacter humi TaxID=2732510 RepID=UPI001C2E96AC|nr:glycoside hydrolase family 95 protein [Mucilaginibacter humi]
MTLRRNLLALVLLCTSCSLYAQNNDLKLWYDAPSGAVWERAMPVGNGRIAGMVYGNPARETIQMNEATLWSGGPSRNDSKTSLAALPEVRRLIFENKYKEAAAPAERTFRSNPNNAMCYQPVGNLFLNFPGHDQYQNYYRDLNISKAIATTTYTVAGVTYKREVFSSHANNVMIVHLTASKPGSLTFSAAMKSPQKSNPGY